MMVLEYDKREFRLIEVGAGDVYRCGYQSMSLTNGIYHFISDNGDRYHIPKDKVVIRELSSNNCLPRL